MSLGLHVTAYNQARYVAAFAARLERVRSLFDEVLFIDNCSEQDDGARFAATGLGRVLRRSDRSTSGALNDGFAMMGTDWVLPIAVDDLLTEDAEPRIRRTLARVPADAAVVLTGRHDIDDSGDVILRDAVRLDRFRVWSPPVRGLLALSGLRQASHVGYLLRRRVLLGILARREEWVEDYGLFTRIALRHVIVESGETWLEYRRTAGSWSADPRPLEASTRVVRNRIVRERWPADGFARRTAEALAAYGSARSCIGLRDRSSALRLSVASLRAAPWLPLGAHTIWLALRQK